MLYFIVNQTAGTGQAQSVWEKISAELIEKNVKYEAYFTEYSGHAKELAGMICRLPGKNKCLIVAGGDGTINEVINGITDFAGLRVGILPIGSGNDLARGLGLPKDPMVMLERILLLAERSQEICVPTDLGIVKSNNGKESRIFAISSGVGMDAIVSKKALTSKLKTVLNRIHLGKLTYVLITVYTLFSMKTASFRVRFYNDHNEVLHEEIYRKVIFMAAMNTYAEGGGVPMAPHADPTDTMLSVCTAYGIPKWRTFFCLPLLLLKKHERLKGFDVRNCDHVRVILSSPMTLHTDGEYEGEVTRIEYRILPQALRLLK